MNLQKLTQKSMEAVRGAQELAAENGNQQITQAHLLLALLRQPEGLIPEILRIMNANPDGLDAKVSTDVSRVPKVTGASSSQQYLSGELDEALTEAEKQAARMTDEFVSVEHLFLGLLMKPDRTLKQHFRDHGITKDAFLSALKDIRGNQRVTSDDPEGT